MRLTWLYLFQAGLGGTYQSIKIPTSLYREKSSNLGYAFVGFKTQEFADSCWLQFSGKVFGRSCTAKVCQIKAAHHQEFAKKTRRCSNLMRELRT